MSIYGGTLNHHEEISLEQFSNILFESDNEVESLFRRLDIGSFNESDSEEDEDDNKSYALSKPGQFDQVKIKKTIFQKIKELIQKFATMIKQLFEKVANAIYKKYMETNFVDSFVKRYRNIMTYKNLQKAFENGWSGYENTMVVGRPANVMDTQFYKDLSLMNDTREEINTLFMAYSKGNVNDYKAGTGFSRIDPKKDIDPILNSDSVEDSKDKYNDFKEKLKDFRALSNSISQLDANESMIDPQSNKGGEIPWYTIANSNKEKNIVMPPDLFVVNTKFAMEGQSNIKKIREAGKTIVRNLNMEKDLLYDNMKSTGNNKDNDMAPKFNLYYKARYEYASAFIFRVKESINLALKIIKQQHKCSIKWYMNSVNAIKKYVKNPANADA